MDMEFFPKRRYRSTTLHGGISQRTVIFAACVVRTIVTSQSQDLANLIPGVHRTGDWDEFQAPVWRWTIRTLSEPCLVSCPSHFFVHSTAHLIIFFAEIHKIRLLKKTQPGTATMKTCYLTVVTIWKLLSARRRNVRSSYQAI